MQADNRAEEIDGLGLILIHNSGAWKNVYQKKLPWLSICPTRPVGRESQTGQDSCGEPRMTVTANWFENCRHVTLTDISLGCLSAWHKSKPLTHVQATDLLQSPKVLLIRLSQNKFSSSMAAVLRAGYDSPTSVSRMPCPAQRIGKVDQQ